LNGQRSHRSKPERIWFYILFLCKSWRLYLYRYHGGFIDEDGNTIEGIEEQTEQCFKNLGKTLKAAGASFDDVVKTTVLLRNAEDFRKMIGVYRRYFDKGFPARTTFVGTDFLDSPCLIQIDAVAYKPKT